MDAVKMALLESRITGSTAQNAPILSTDSGFLERSNSLSSSAVFDGGNASTPANQQSPLSNTISLLQVSNEFQNEVMDNAGKSRKRKDTPDSSGDSLGKGNSQGRSASSNRTTRKTKTQNDQIIPDSKPLAHPPLSRKKSNNEGPNQKSITSFYPNESPDDENPSLSSTVSSSSQSHVSKRNSPITKKTSAKTSAKVSNGRNMSNQFSSIQQFPPSSPDSNKRIQQLEQLLEERKLDHDSHISQLQQRLAEVTKEAEDWKTKSIKVIETLVKERADVSAEDIRQRHSMDTHRLGKLVLQRVSSLSGSGVSEYWEDGRAMREVKDAQGGMLLREESIKKLNRDKVKAAKEAAKAPKLSAEGGECIEDILVHEAEESAKSRLAMLKRNQVRLAEDRGKLERETLVYRREVKRCALEDHSRFKRGQRTGANGEYILTSLLGKGGFSEVWKAFDLVRLMDVAVKVHQLSDNWTDEKKANYTKHATREYRIHKDLSHPHVVKLYDVFEINANAFATVLESCEGGDLDHRLKSDKLLPETEAKPVLLQIVAGLRYLNTPNSVSHMKAIIHYDLKPGNILFDERGDAKITDFGLSKIVDGSHEDADIELTSQGTGTYWYLPPECFRISPGSAPRISSKVDVWSLGVIYYQMLYGKRPFGEGESQEQLLRNNTMLSAGPPQFPDKPKVSPQAKDFLKSCLCADQVLRPDVLELCRDPYLRAPPKNSK